MNTFGIKSKHMKTILTTILFLVSITFSAIADEGNKPEKKIISGIVIDQNTGEPLEGVKLVVLNTDQVIYTDNLGNFQVEKNISEDIQFSVELISYEKLIVKSSGLEDTSANNITLSLTELD